MFEKEAEKNAERKISNFIPQQWGVSLIRTEPTCETVEGAPHFYLNSLAKMWQDGAEFGYNKANEWHYVKDGKPKDNEYVLIYTEIKNTYVARIPTGKDYFITRSGGFVQMSAVIAWKEIVLPKEIKDE